jgi:hypothetical protein
MRHCFINASVSARVPTAGLAISSSKKSNAWRITAFDETSSTSGARNDRTSRRRRRNSPKSSRRPPEVATAVAGGERDQAITRDLAANVRLCLVISRAGFEGLSQSRRDDHHVARRNDTGSEPDTRNGRPRPARNGSPQPPSVEHKPPALLDLAKRERVKPHGECDEQAI